MTNPSDPLENATSQTPKGERLHGTDLLDYLRQLAARHPGWYGGTLSPQPWFRFEVIPPLDPIVLKGGESPTEKDEQ